MMRAILTVVAIYAVGIVCQDPGYPHENPSTSYWQIPENEDVADIQSETLPSNVDVVIIGSGISGTSIAWHLLKETSTNKTLSIAMLESRQACSGASGRNGGQIRPSSYSEYAEARKYLPQEEAIKITRFRAAHIDALLSAAKQLPEAEFTAVAAREVDGIDAYFNEDDYAAAVRQLEDLKTDLPEIGSQWTAVDGDPAKKISLLQHTVGIITSTPKLAAAVWAYRFVTHSLRMLLDDYDSFSLDTRTTALNVSAIKCQGDGANFEVTTNRGKIAARHVVYATNAWTPHFVPTLQGLIVGTRLPMSAQLGGNGLPKPGKWPASSKDGSLPGGRAYSFFREGLEGLDYVVQMPENGEFMFGGAVDMIRDNASLFSMDDSAPPVHAAASYLNGALPDYFGYDTWGAERTDFPKSNDPRVSEGRTKAVWTGIEGFSVDGLPFVGRLPTEAISSSESQDGRKGSEWVSASFSGEGMCFAWLSGKALSTMLLAEESGDDPGDALEWFPESFAITPERLNETKFTSI